MKNPFIFLFLFWAFVNTFAQNTCEFTVDTLAVLNNSRLETIINELEMDSLVVRNDKEYLSQEIKAQIECLISDDFLFANPNEPFNSSCFVDPNLPYRQIDLLATNSNCILLTYTKNVGAGIDFITLIIVHNEKTIREFWTASVHRVFKDLPSILYYLKEGLRINYDFNMFGLPEL